MSSAKSGSLQALAVGLHNSARLVCEDKLECSRLPRPCDGEVYRL